MACGGAAACPGVVQAPRWRRLHAAAGQSACPMIPIGGDQAHGCLLRLQSKPAETAGLLDLWFTVSMVAHGERLCCTDLGCSVAQQIQCLGCHVRATA